MEKCITAPEHVGIIMDGNGRWAEGRSLPRLHGHTAGMKNMMSIAAHAFDRGAKTVTCYSMSAENLNRPKEEVRHILSLVSEYFDPFLKVFLEKQVAVKFVGNLELLPLETRASLQKTEELLSHFESSGKILYVAIAYGSRQEIVKTVNQAIIAGVPVTEDGFLKMLGLPVDLDMIIRTGGEQRLSNFFLYQSSYAELYFSDKFFPDFTGEDLDNAFLWFQNRKRRYGLL